MIAVQLLVALLIATVVYRWQKEIDRETALIAEFRRLCAEYIRASKIAYFEQPFADEKDEEKIQDFLRISGAEQQAYIARDQLFLLAPSDILDLVIAHDRAFRNWKSAYAKHIKSSGDDPEDVRLTTAALLRAHNEMLKGMRTSQQLLPAKMTFRSRIFASFRRMPKAKISSTRS